MRSIKKCDKVEIIEHTERVTMERANKKSLMDETPRLIRYIIDQIQ